MQRVSESVSTDKSIDQIFAVFKDVNKLPEWSILINSVEDLGGGSYSANTKMGPLKFQWQVDEGNKKCTFTANVMGTIYSAFYEVKTEGGKTVLVEDLPLNPMATEDQIKDAIKQELNKVIELA